MDENVNGLGSLHSEYYYTRIYLDLARMEEYVWQVLHALCWVLREDYKGFEEAYNRSDLFLHADLRKMNGLVERYTRCEDAVLVGEMMKEYCVLLIEASP